MTPATIDAARLGGWLDTALPGPSAPVSIAQGEQGAGEPVFRADRAGLAYALHLLPSGFGRAFSLLKGLARSPIQHPRLVAACPDGAVLGAPFVLTQWVEGFTPGDTPPEPYRTEAGARSLAEELIDGLVAITIANWPAMGLSGLGDPEGFLKRQVDHWVARSHEVQVPELATLRDWISANVPPTQRKTLVHGEYGFRNAIFSPNQPPRLAAILGWGTATIGDPMTDLGDVLAGWPDPDEPVPPAGGTDWSLFPPRTELVRRYAQRTALGISNLKFYLAFALFKQAVTGHNGERTSAILARAHHFAGLG